MKEPKNLKDIYYWLEVELSIIHFMLYIIMGILLGGKWWILIIFLMIWNTIFAFKKINKNLNK